MNRRSGSVDKTHSAKRAPSGVLPRSRGRIGSSLPGAGWPYERVVPAGALSSKDGEAAGVVASRRPPGFRRPGGVLTRSHSERHQRQRGGGPPTRHDGTYRPSPWPRARRLRASTLCSRGVAVTGRALDVRPAVQHDRKPLDPGDACSLRRWRPHQVTCGSDPWCEVLTCPITWDYQGATRNTDANTVDPIRPGARNFVALRHEIRCRS